MAERCFGGDIFDAKRAGSEEHGRAFELARPHFVTEGPAEDFDATTAQGRSVTFQPVRDFGNTGYGSSGEALVEVNVEAAIPELSFGLARPLPSLFGAFHVLGVAETHLTHTRQRRSGMHQIWRGGLEFDPPFA